MGFSDLIPESFRTPGLSAAELDAAQTEAGVCFPPDLCELLTETLPIGRQFPDWRTSPKDSFAAFRGQLISGIEFDVLDSGLWLAAWGEKPQDHAEVRSTITEKILDAPASIPVYAHRCIPNEPLEAGNPVFSIMQTDAIVYGVDLGHYLRHEFGPDGWAGPEHPP